MDPHSFWTFSPATVLWGLLAAAVWHDMRRRRIPNRLVFSGALLGVLLNSVVWPGVTPAGPWLALGGLAVGLGLLLPMYAMKALGAGDVKLMAMVGAFLGPRPAVFAVLCSLLAGGVLALAVALCQGTLRQAMSNARQLLLQGWLRAAAGEVPRVDAPAVPGGKLPYAIAIAAGTAIWLALAAGGYA
ncbi:A24 family peptidase [Janthinobacterium sp. P210005]|uniref:A24 family peptidase n=1 Tax=Janthinobacterium sp. P210005 TaxID=3112938 RepID=UPI002E26B45B|nr:A24 family peptidase [Janthinobacterium sp. P210005]